MIAHIAASLITLVASSLIQPVAFSLVKAISGKGQEGVFLPLLALPLMTKVWGKGLRSTRRRYNNTNKDF